MIASPLPDLTGVWAQTVHRLGSPMTYRPHGGGAPVDLVGGFATVGAADADVIAALGLGARIITVVADDLPGPPAKFDRVAIAGGLFTVDSWQPVIVNGVTVGWRGYVRGLAQ